MSLPNQVFSPTDAQKHLSGVIFMTVKGNPNLVERLRLSSNAVYTPLPDKVDSDSRLNVFTAMLDNLGIKHTVIYPNVAKLGYVVVDADLHSVENKLPNPLSNLAVHGAIFIYDRNVFSNLAFSLGTYEAPVDNNKTTIYPHTPVRIDRGKPDIDVKAELAKMNINLGSNDSVGGPVAAAIALAGGKFTGSAELMATHFPEKSKA